MNKKVLTPLGFVPLLLATSVNNALAQEPSAEAEVEKIAVVGSRSLKQRSVADSTVPIDLIDSDDLNAIG